MSMYEADVEPYMPFVPDEFAGYDENSCPNCEKPLTVDAGMCVHCGWWDKDDPA